MKLSVAVTARQTSMSALLCTDDHSGGESPCCNTQFPLGTSTTGSCSYCLDINAAQIQSRRAERFNGL